MQVLQHLLLVLETGVFGQGWANNFSLVHITYRRFFIFSKRRQQQQLLFLDPFNYQFFWAYLHGPLPSMTMF